jgi:glycosyltransferase involved in cell wall biosynthesis
VALSRRRCQTRAVSKVTVVIPVYDGERFLAEAIDSTLAQDHDDLELIVVDDGSTDRSAEIAESYERVRCIRQRNAGPAAARNTAIVQSTGDLVTFLDADDAMMPGRLTRQVEYLRDHTEAGAVAGRQEIVLEPGATEPWWALEPSPWVKHVPIAEMMYTLSMMVRRPVFDEVGLFDPEFRLAEDLDWLFRLIESGIELAVLEDVLIKRRVHDANVTIDYPASQAAMLRALKARIDRRRAAAAQAGL